MIDGAGNSQSEEGQRVSKRVSESAVPLRKDEGRRAAAVDWRLVR